MTAAAEPAPGTNVITVLRAAAEEIRRSGRLVSIYPALPDVLATWLEHQAEAHEAMRDIGPQPGGMSIETQHALDAAAAVRGAPMSSTPELLMAAARRLGMASLATHAVPHQLRPVAEWLELAAQVHTGELPCDWCADGCCPPVDTARAVLGHPRVPDLLGRWTPAPRKDT